MAKIIRRAWTSLGPTGKRIRHVKVRSVEDARAPWLQAVVASQVASSAPDSSGGGASLRSLRVRSAATRCWFSWRASVRVA